MREPFQREERGFQVNALLSWYDSSERALPWLVKSLKGQEDAAVWRQIATLFLQVFGVPQAQALVPVPSAHSRGLARALSELSGLPIHDVLIATKPSGQKRLNRGERQRIGFAIQGDCSKYTSVIVCDDVVTTGATARAAMRALGLPSRSAVWCLVDRRPCGG
jgi:predicted amidophosphoribosyltransferase